MLEGRGMFYGAVAPDGRSNNIFDEARWHTTCQQAVSWGMHYVHPKVADGGYWWYDNNGMQMLKSVATSFGLTVAPYHYCYGDKYGALTHEAQICAAVGNIFGCVCPDIEVEWDNQPGWATKFGQIVRASYKGEIVPTLFANPQQHPTPYAELSEWITGWMPMVYFAVWTPPTAQHAIDFVYPQWEALDQHLEASHITPKPILPLIEVGNGLAASEVATWLTKMQYYGYCGFWYANEYTPYAKTVLDAPVPQYKGQQPPTPPPAQQQQQQQQLPPEYAIAWFHNDPGHTVGFILSHAIPQRWVECIQKGVPIGSPIGGEYEIPNYGVVQEYEGGRIYWNKDTNNTMVVLH